MIQSVLQGHVKNKSKISPPVTVTVTVTGQKYEGLCRSEFYRIFFAITVQGSQCLSPSRPMLWLLSPSQALREPRHCRRWLFSILPAVLCLHLMQKVCWVLWSKVLQTAQSSYSRVVQASRFCATTSRNDTDATQTGTSHKFISRSWIAVVRYTPS
jgi:hypothetical protein